MGACDCINYYKDLTKKQLKKTVESDTTEMRYESGQSYSGTWASKPSGINFLSRTFKSQSEAEDYIMDNNDKWECVDAAFYTEKLGTPTQLERIKKQKQKLIDTKRLEQDFYSQTFSKIKNVKAKTKKCKSCGTIHPIANLGRLSCSSCGNLLITETETKKLSKIKEKISNEDKKLITLISKKGGKSVKGWVVGGWCSS